jgi:hypothetical protein
MHRGFTGESLERCLIMPPALGRALVCTTLHRPSNTLSAYLHCSQSPVPLTVLSFSLTPFLILHRQLITTFY